MNNNKSIYNRIIKTVKVMESSIKANYDRDGCHYSITDEHAKRYDTGNTRLRKGSRYHILVDPNPVKTYFSYRITKSVNIRNLEAGHEKTQWIKKACALNSYIDRKTIISYFNFIGITEKTDIDEIKEYIQKEPPNQCTMIGNWTNLWGVWSRNTTIPDCPVYINHVP